MTDYRYLGIEFPIQEDLKGKYLSLTKTQKDRVKSNLINLITTMKGERWRKPDFGTNLPQYLFEPMDEQTYSDIRQEIIGTVTKHLSDVNIVNVELKADNETNFVGIKIGYTISTGVFKEPDTIDIVF